MIEDVGVDLVEVGRIRDAIEKHGERFLDRVYTPGEREFCARFQDAYRRYAARFASKEAVFKVLGTGWSGGVAWRDVEVLGGGDHAPRVALHGKAAEAAKARGIESVKLSISHGEDLAIAVAVGRGATKNF